MERMIRSTRVEVNKWEQVVTVDYESLGRNRFEYEVGNYVCQDDLVNDKVQDISGSCNICGRNNMEHGWLGSAIQGVKVCPGDYIMKIKDNRVVLKPDVYVVLFGEDIKKKEVELKPLEQMTMNFD